MTDHQINYHCHRCGIDATTVATPIDGEQRFEEDGIPRFPTFAELLVTASSQKIAAALEMTETARRHQATAKLN